jgi:hypothetical protein
MSGKCKNCKVNNIVNKKVGWCSLCINNNLSVDIMEKIQMFSYNSKDVKKCLCNSNGSINCILNMCKSCCNCEGCELHGKSTKFNYLNCSFCKTPCEKLNYYLKSDKSKLYSYCKKCYNEYKNNFNYIIYKFSNSDQIKQMVIKPHETVKEKKQRLEFDKKLNKGPKTIKKKIISKKTLLKQLLESNYITIINKIKEKEIEKHFPDYKKKIIEEKEPIVENNKENQENQDSIKNNSTDLVNFDDIIWINNLGDEKTTGELMCEIKANDDLGFKFFNSDLIKENKEIFTIKFCEFVDKKNQIIFLCECGKASDADLVIKCSNCEQYKGEECIEYCKKSCDLKTCEYDDYLCDNSQWICTTCNKNLMDKFKEKYEGQIITSDILLANEINLNHLGFTSNIFYCSTCKENVNLIYEKVSQCLQCKKFSCAGCGSFYIDKFKTSDTDNSPIPFYCLDCVNAIIKKGEKNMGKANNSNNYNDPDNPDDWVYSDELLDSDNSDDSDDSYDLDDSDDSDDLDDWDNTDNSFNLYLGYFSPFVPNELSDTKKLNPKNFVKFPPFVKLESDSLASTKSEECSICYTNKKSYACVPCGHLCLCYKCSNQINGKCPLCNVSYDEIIRIYS